MTTIDAGIYGGGPLYKNGQPLMDELRASGMTIIVAWALHVHTNGDLVFNDTLIVSGGEYVGNADWPAQLASLKQSPTSVQRLYFSIGGWDVPDFANIQQLLQGGVGPDNILYRNFSALKQALAPDGIDFDDESLYDPGTTTEFATLLNSLGFEVSFCPYTNTTFWVDALKGLNTVTPGLVTRFNLQCYAGGMGNEPADWISAIAKAMPPDFDAAGFVYPGLWCRNKDPDGEPGWCPAEVTATFEGWSASQLQGGWIWLLDDVLTYENSGLCSGAMDVEAYASALQSGLAG